MNRDTLTLCTGDGQMDLLNPTPEQVNAADMLRNLSRLCDGDKAVPGAERRQK